MQMKYETSHSLHADSSMGAQVTTTRDSGYFGYRLDRPVKPEPAPVSAPRAPAHAPQQNCMLAALPPADLERMRPQLELVSLPSDLVVFGSCHHSAHGYFPTTSIVTRR